MTNSNFEADPDSEEAEDEVFGTEDLTFHVSPRKDATVELNTQQTSILDVTVNKSDVDRNIASIEPIISSIPEQTSVTPSKCPIFKSNVQEDRSPKQP